MATIGDALKEALKGKEELLAGAVADTWYTLGVTTHEIHSVVAAYFLNKQGILTRITSDVQEEHEWNHRLPPSHEKYLDSEGVPKAPRSLEKILEGTRTHLAGRTFTENEAKILANTRLTQTDKRVAFEAKILAQNFGHCYVVTNDTDLIRQIRDAIREQNLNITLLMPSTIEHDLAYMLPELGLKLLVPSQVLAELYKRGSGEQQHKGQPYVHILRAQPYKFGSTTITADIATEVLSTEAEKRIPANMREYGVPVVFVNDRSETGEGINTKNLASYIRQSRKGRPNIVVALESEKFLPQFLMVKVDKTGVSYPAVSWARI